MIYLLKSGDIFTTVSSIDQISLVPDYEHIKNDLTLEPESVTAWINPQIDQIHANMLTTATGNATVEERDTWQSKALAAAAHVAGSSTPAQEAGLQAEAGAVGSTVDDLAALIMSKSDAYSLLVGVAAGMRRSAIAAVEAAATADEKLALFEAYKVAVADALEQL